MIYLWSIFPGVSSLVHPAVQGLLSFSLYFCPFHWTAGQIERGPLALRAPFHPSTLRGNPPIIPFTSSLLNLIRVFSSPKKETATSITHSADRREEGLNEIGGEGSRTDSSPSHTWTDRGCCSSSFASCLPFLPPFSPLALGRGAIIWGTFWTFMPVPDSMPHCYLWYNSDSQIVHITVLSHTTVSQAHLKNVCFLRLHRTYATNKMVSLSFLA